MIGKNVNGKGMKKKPTWVKLYSIFISPNAADNCRLCENVVIGSSLIVS